MSDTERNVLLSIGFELRNEKIRATSGTFELNGVPTGRALDAALGVIEETICHELKEYPKVKELLEWKFPLGADNTLWGLEERTKTLLLKLLAHQVLLGRVASRHYVTNSVSAMMSFPHDG